MKIPLTQGLFAVVSPEDYPVLAAHKWHAVRTRNTHYAARRHNNKTIYMHRSVLSVTEHGRELFVDHKDHNGLNNTRENLRACSPKENAQNRRYASDYLGLRGVRLQGDKWHAQITGLEGKLVFLGAFDTQREAGIAFSAASRVLGREAI